MTELMDERNTEQRLLEKAKRGDRQAFDGLLALYEDALASFISTRVGSQLRKKVEVRDVVQDVMLTAWQSLSDFEPKDEGSFLRWLCGIAQNRILHLARHHFPPARPPRSSAARIRRTVSSAVVTVPSMDSSWRGIRGAK